MPMPRAPVEVNVEVAVAPKDALFAERMDEKNVVEVPLVRVSVPSDEAPVKVRLVPKRLPAVNAVDDAYGNCDAAAVLEEKNAPMVQMDVVVAAVVVDHVVEKSKALRPAR